MRSAAPLPAAPNRAVTFVVRGAGRNSRRRHDRGRSGGRVRTREPVSTARVGIRRHLRRPGPAVMNAPAANDQRAKQLGFLQAINQAQTEEMERDERVVLMGQDLRANVFGAAEGALDRFGPARVRDLPLAEAASVGMCAGAAMTGLRPVLDLTVASFVFGAMDQFVSQVAKARYMFGGQ